MSANHKTDPNVCIPHVLNLRKWRAFRARNAALDIYSPQMWANEALFVLKNQIVIGRLLHRDFSKDLAVAGHVVNVQRPSRLTATRLGSTDNLTFQDPDGENVAVKLNQPTDVTFKINDINKANSLLDLSRLYMTPAMIAMSERVDAVCAMQVYRYLSNAVGGLGLLTSSNAWQYVLAAGVKLDNNKVAPSSRFGILSATAKGTMLENTAFFEADKVGDMGVALREASIGRKGGIGFFMSQSVPAPVAGAAYNDIRTGAINNSGGYAAGIDTVTVDGFSAAIAAGQWITIGGEMRPHRVLSTTGGTTPTVIEFAPALAVAVANDAVVTVYDPGAVNLVGGYAAGWTKPILLDGFTNFPQVGQAVCFDTAGTNIYGVLEASPTAGSVVLDRPLETAIANDADVFTLPAGTYNSVFNPLAAALVNRPLPLAAPGMGAVMAIAMDEDTGLAVRVVMSWSHDKRSTQVTIDTIFGVTPLYPEMLVPLLT